MQTLASLAVYTLACLVCYGVAYLLNLDLTSVVAYFALAIAVNSTLRVD